MMSRLRETFSMERTKTTVEVEDVALVAALLRRMR